MTVRLRNIDEIMLLIYLPGGNWQCDKDFVAGSYGTFCRIYYDESEYGGSMEPEMKRDTMRLVAASKNLIRILVEDILDDASQVRKPEHYITWIEEVRRHPERYKRMAEKFNVLEMVFGKQLEDILYRKG